MKKSINLSSLPRSLGTIGQKTNSLPGINVSLAQVPSGINQTKTTDKDGKVNFDNLPTGYYSITFEKLEKVENHNSSRSNKSTTVRKGGITDVNVTVTLVWSGSSRKPHDQPIEVEIPQYGGNITVKFSEEVSISNNPVAMQSTPKQK